MWEVGTSTPKTPSWLAKPNAELAGKPNAELAGIPNAVGVMTLSKKGECPNPLKIFAPNY